MCNNSFCPVISYTLYYGVVQVTVLSSAADLDYRCMQTRRVIFSRYRFQVKNKVSAQPTSSRRREFTAFMSFETQC
jgi:hypothetical protein